MMNFFKRIFGDKKQNQTTKNQTFKIQDPEIQNPEIPTPEIKHSEIKTPENQIIEDKTLKNIYEKSVDIFFDNFRDPDLIKEQIYELTNSYEDSNLIYLFIPHFFCRLFVPEVKYTNYYVFENIDKTKTEIKFSDSKILSELFDSIQLNWDNYLERDLMKILVQSGDFRAINEMLHKGSKVEGLQALPPTVALPQSSENINSKDESETTKILELMFQKAVKKINYSEFQNYFLIEGKDYSKIFFNLIFTRLVLEIPKEDIVMDIYLKLEQIEVKYPFWEIDKIIVGNKKEELNDEILLYREILHMQNNGANFENIVKTINTSH
ncbi:hypothetical protein [Flavobacterium hibisci]|uniref:hypothetical protein n=1 Tax=Flavobacterium hibisci TaxID=1914462 RepID=UPI001CBC7CC8|nr:hypothetical protein [Flavobacterium hibisci]MBZ4041235.1 hypothetical protein [Flavobacterium hibisci]